MATSNTAATTTSKEKELAASKEAVAEAYEKLLEAKAKRSTFVP